MKKSVFVLIALLTFSGCAAVPEETRTVVFYPPLPQRPRLQFLHAITGEEDIGQSQGAFTEFLVGKPTSDKRIGKAWDIASSDGKIYVLDRRSKRLLIIDLIRRKFDNLRDQRMGELEDPSGIWVTEDDVKYIADMGRKQIVVFGANNEFSRSYGGPDLFDKPVDVAVYQNTVYVSDMNKNKIFVLDKTSGKLKGTIGELGQDKGQFSKPTHVVVDHEGNIYVTDAFNFRVQKFDPDGKFLKSYGYLGDGFGAFARPKGLDIDRDGHLYVVDAAFENVQIFDDKTGALLLFFGGPGTAPGSMYLPAGIHIDYRNAAYFSNFVDRDFRLNYVVYTGNFYGTDKLNVYGFGDWVGEPLRGE
ncbi:MAG: 6-bladed beta-propeller [Desulfobacterales bacterium]|nr:MAG: 6-bladed beta-propeller [Desulfobacterales bacterium]